MPQDGDQMTQSLYLLSALQLSYVGNCLRRDILMGTFLR